MAGLKSDHVQKTQVKKGQKMKKNNSIKIISLFFVCALILCALTIIAFAAEDKTVEIASNNVYYGEKYQIMYAIKAPDGAEITAADSKGNAVEVIPFTEDPTVTLNGVEYDVYVTKSGVAIQSIDEVVTVTVRAGDETATQSYSVLQYVYERINVSDNKATGMELEMFNDLLKHANSADMFINGTPASESISNYRYVTVTNGTIDGTNKAGMYLEGATPFANITTDLVAGENETVKWQVSIDGENLTNLSLSDVKVLPVTGNMTVTATVSSTVAAGEYVDFIVSVPEDREPVILHLTDMQIVDASQERTSDRLGSTLDEYWAVDKKDERCYDYLREIIDSTDPDLILITGDLVYGEFDDNGESFLELVEFMESYGIPWAPIFGNHEIESKMGADWQCEQLENAEHCLFLQRELTGNGNYTVGIEQGGKLTRVFFMLDSNGCGAASSQSLANGHTKTGVGFGSDQIEWYTEVANNIIERSPATKFSFGFHIQLSVFGEAFAKYNTDGTTHVFIDRSKERVDGDFGYIGAAMKYPWDTSNTVWSGLKALGVDSIFVGHEHSNSASIVYDGVRLQYGMKCSTYDRANYISSTGTITTAYSSSTDTPWIGGSYFKLTDDGSIKDADIYYCEEAGGNIDWDSFEPDEPIYVDGLQKDTDFTYDGGLDVSAVEFDENTNAYKAIANGQVKLYIKTSLIKNKSTFTFTVYVPSTSTNKLSGYGEFAIRVKPNDLEPEGDGQVTGSAGYIDFNSSSELAEYRIEYDTWQTFTVDISGFGESCTEFAFVVPSGNTIYLKDMVIEGATEEEPTVNGLQFGTDLTLQNSDTSVTVVEFDDGTLAYEMVAPVEYRKVYVNTELLKNKSTVTFTVYVPSTSTNKLSRYGEFAIRVKPTEPSGDGSVDGYISFNAASSDIAYDLKYDEWQTFTIDISGFGVSCTEFAFTLAVNNPIYVKDIVIQ